MALKKPLVLGSNNKPEQLQSGDTLVDGLNQYQMLNGNAGNLIIGTPVYVSAAGTVDKARANAVGTSNAIGLWADVTTATGQPGFITINDTMTATTGQWDAITGQVGGLTPGATYFLDEATAGRLKTGQIATGFVQEIGIALSTTDMLVQPKQTIKL